MNYRHTKILASTSLTNNTTYTLDLNLVDPISRISVVYKALNGDSVPDGHMASGVTKIELVDGSDVLFSMSGKETQATDFYDTGKEPVNGMTYTTGNYPWAIFNMNFGRFLFDDVLALDPKRFKNLQLKVTHNYSLCGSSCSASTLEVWGDVFQDKKVSPRGFLMNKELYTYTMGASGSYEYIDLPTDYPYRRLTVFGMYANYQPWQIANEIRIDENNLKQVIVDDLVSNLLKTAAGLYGVYTEGLIVTATTSVQSFYCTPTYFVSASAMNMGDTDTILNLDSPSYGGELKLEGEGAGLFSVIVRGWAPNGAIPIPFGDEQNIADFYNITTVGSVQLRIKAGTLGGTASIQVVLQQMRTY